MIDITQDPVSLYIHIPWCIKKCPYCDFNSHANSNTIPEDQYVTAIQEDFLEQKKYLENRKIKSIFFGGGTPSLFSGDGIGKILDFINKEVNFINDIEITLEANPGAIDRDQFKLYRDKGINRISLGIQSFDNNNLISLGRVHNKKDIYAAIELIHNCHFKSFNVDIMYGLPLQNIHNAIEDLESALQFSPPHLSWYQLTIEPNTIFYSKRPKLPKDEVIENIENIGIQLLKSHNLKRYEVSAYSKSSHQCIHNINYWTYGDYIGLGAGAHSKITLKQQVFRIQKVRQPNSYLDPKKNKISKRKHIDQENLLFEFMLNNLRLFNNIPLKLLRKQTGLDINNYQEKFELAKDKKLMYINQDYMIVTDLGKKYLNDLTEIFLP